MTTQIQVIEPPPTKTKKVSAGLLEPCGARHHRRGAVCSKETNHEGSHYDETRDFEWKGDSVRRRRK